MPIGLLFWILMLLWLVLGLYWDYTPGQPYPFHRGANHVLIFVLLALLGYAAFGKPIR